MIPVFEDELRKYAVKHKFRMIDISETDSDRIDTFVRAVVNRKKAETHHMCDNKNEAKRFYTGMMGEVALEKFLGINFIDWTIGDSAKYHVPDLSRCGMNVGIKTVEYYKFPIIFKTVQCPEIINLRLNRNKLIILGVASMGVLQKYRSDSLILSAELRKRGTKTGFYGFEHLIPFDDLQQLRALTL